MEFYFCNENQHQITYHLPALLMEVSFAPQRAAHRAADRRIL